MVTQNKEEMVIMVKWLTVIVMGILFGGLNGCSPNYTLNKTEEVGFAGIPEVTRIDNGTKNTEGKLRIGGYYTAKMDDPGKSVYKKTVIDTNSFNEISITDYRSVMYEPKGSFGADLTYSFNDFFGIGPQMDFASVRFGLPTDSILEDQLNMFRMGVHGRFTSSNKYVTVGYRPELYFGKFEGLQKTYDENLILLENEIFHKAFIAFDHSVFVRVSPIEMVGAFVGFRHSYKPYAIIDNNCLHRSDFLFYGGASVELLDMVSIGLHVATPVIVENYASARDVSVGGSIGIMFNKNGRGGDDD